jgi:hypothetical protein
MLVMISPSKVSAENLLPFEHVSIFVDCDKAERTVACGIQPGNNTEIVHFPSSVHVISLFDVGCTGLYTVFGKKSSVLAFEFNNVSPSVAKDRAEQWSQIIESVFDTTFTWDYTNTSSTTTFVHYSNSGATNATIYSCLNQCLNWTYGADKPLGGFSKTILPLLTHAINEYTDYSVGVGTGKGFWEEDIKSVDMGLTVSYTQKIANSTGSHKIDVLSLLGVGSLAPSRYAFNNISKTYSSTVFLTISSSKPVGFVSCEPSSLNPQNRGWYSTPSTSNIDAQFQFRRDNSSVTPLTFTFSGQVGVIPAIVFIVTASPTTVYSGGTSTIKASLTNMGTLITGATIIITPAQGSLSAINDLGDGTYTSTYTAPEVTTQVTSKLSATASKTGLVNSSAETEVTVKPLTLNITVRGSDGATLVNASLQSTAQPTGQATLSKTTGSGGTVVFTGMIKGSYTFKASKTGYDDKTWTFTVKTGQATVETVTLTKQSGAAGGGIPGYTYESAVLGIIIFTLILITHGKKQFPSSHN